MSAYLSHWHDWLLQSGGQHPQLPEVGVVAMLEQQLLLQTSALLTYR